MEKEHKLKNKNKHKLKNKGKHKGTLPAAWAAVMVCWCVCPPLMDSALPASHPCGLYAVTLRDPGSLRASGAFRFYGSNKSLPKPILTVRGYGQLAPESKGSGVCV